MEAFLLKIARQLDSLDEASLLELWNKYAEIVSKFEPTKRWEEATLILSLIQAKRWKNQLFNYHWSTQTCNADLGASLFSIDLEDVAKGSAAHTKTSQAPNKATILPFKQRPCTSENKNEEN